MVFGGIDFYTLLHIILVVFMFGGSNQTFGKSQCYCVSTKHIFRFQPIWHYGVSVRPCYCVSFDQCVGLCQGVSLCYWGGGPFPKFWLCGRFLTLWSQDIRYLHLKNVNFEFWVPIRPNYFDFQIVRSKIKIYVDQSVTYQNLSGEQQKSNGKRIRSIRVIS